jgi:poly [ADP-ribose] polymerase 2/3/4
MEGYKYLREIEKVLNKKAKGDLADLSSKFYTFIPHDFGMKHMSNFTIKTHDMIKQKLDLIQNLIDIKIAAVMVEDKKALKGPKVNLIDQNYGKLACDIKTLDSKSPDYKLVEEYLNNTKEH